MKAISAAILATLFTTGAGAAGFEEYLGLGHSGSSPPAGGSAHSVGVQPSVGDSIDRYHGLSDGNPDLFQSEGRGMSQAGRLSDKGSVVYVGPGLRF